MEEQEVGWPELLAVVILTECTLSLWANAGLYLTCRVYIGKESVEFQHSFDGATPYEVPNICLCLTHVNILFVPLAAFFYPALA